MKVRIALPLIAFLASALVAWMIHRKPAEASIAPMVGRQNQAAERAHPPRPGPTPRAIPEAPAPCDARTLAELEAEHQRLLGIQGVLKHNRSGYEALDKGMPLSFPEQTADRFRQEGFRANLRQALGELEDPPELVAVDCDECPCIAAIKTRGGLASAYELSCRLRESRTWKEKYAEPGRMGKPAGLCPYLFGDLNRVVAKSCGQGRTERFVMVSPVWDCRSGEEFSAAEYARRIEQRSKSGRLHEQWEIDNVSRRTTLRQKALVNKLECTGP